MILVTGGAGFIGSNFLVDWHSRSDEPTVNVDKLTYAGNAETLAVLADNESYHFEQLDICNQTAISRVVDRFRPRAIIHFAAESHVDRSIHAPGEFIRTNIDGTFVLLEVARAFHAKLSGAERDSFRFLHISTDEVYGSLGPAEPPFSETTPYAPNSPYSASKAASDHLVRAYHHTYGLPTLTTNCSNNYGPYQFPEKLLPLMIINALSGRQLPVYGDGLNIRDWLYVGDHCAALRAILARGAPGSAFNIGGWNEKTNLDVVCMVCGLLDELRPKTAGSYADQIEFVKDRAGHDRRYAIDARKLEQELGWTPAETFETGLRKTVEWYLANPAWIDSITSGAYRHWIDHQYGSA